ncbi:hypothetical protein ACVDG3_19835 [Meridianimarinicoccus sp. RP-17]|uniref:hypothetical protein n=1 Tax=Meridianimarinicoccus zhengii TaxID=2056810 RepID=UPI000DACADE8|nr:hypothetical protein [Phycocomes zhengii]
MIDYAMEIFREETPPLPAPREPGEAELRPGNSALAEAARTAAGDRDAADPERQPADPIPDLDRDTDARASGYVSSGAPVPEANAGQVTAAPEKERVNDMCAAPETERVNKVPAAPETERVKEAPADPARSERDRLFEAAALSLRALPAPQPLRAVFVRFEAAPRAELESAVRAMVALFLRAPAKARAPMQAALTEALHAEVGTRFAVRLAVRLGGVFAPAPGPEPDAPPEDDP